MFSLESKVVLLVVSVVSRRVVSVVSEFTGGAKKLAAEVAD